MTPPCARMAVVALVVLAGCTALFPFAASPGGDGGPPAKDAGSDSGRDGGSTDASHEAGQPPPEAGIDAAPCLGVDADGDGTPCESDCDDGDPLRHPGAPWPTFVYEDVAGADNHFDFVIAADGTPTIVYADENDDVQLATPDANGWVPSPIADAFENARQIDLAGSMAGLIACFWDEGNDGGPLRVWRGRDGQTTDLTGDLPATGPACAVAVDDAGNEHVAYYDSGTGLVMYRSGLDGQWALPETVGAARLRNFGEYWSRIAIVPSAEGNPWVAYDTDGADALVIARRMVGGEWTPSPSEFAGRLPAIALADGDLEVCFKKTDDDKMAHVTWQPGAGWAVPQTFGDARTNDLWCSLGRYGGAPYVAWQEEPEVDAYAGLIARRLDDVNWEFARLTPPDSTDLPRRPLLAVDLDGHLHVVYLDQASGILKHGVLHEDCP